MLKIAVLLAALVAQPVFALTPLAPPVNPQLNIDPNAPDIPCDQIAKALDDYNTMARQNDAAVNSYLNDLQKALTDWHTQLAPLEGQATTVPAGTFSVLADGSSKVKQLNTAAFDNTSLLAAELGRITYSLSNCKVVAP